MDKPAGESESDLNQVTARAIEGATDEDAVNRRRDLIASGFLGYGGWFGVPEKPEAINVDDIEWTLELTTAMIAHTGRDLRKPLDLVMTVGISDPDNSWDSMDDFLASVNEAMDAVPEEYRSMVWVEHEYRDWEGFYGGELVIKYRVKQTDEDVRQGIHDFLIGYIGRMRQERAQYEQLHAKFGQARDANT